MSAVLSVTEITLAVILGVLAAIVYSLRVLVLLERRMARIDENLEHIVMKVAKDEELIEAKLGIKNSALQSKSSKKTTAKAKPSPKKKK